MLTPFADDIWVATRPVRFLGVETGTRMTIVRLRGGGLFVHSPVALDPATKAAVDALGEVRAVVAPSRFHHLHVGAWMAAFPRAMFGACPGLERKRDDLPFTGVVADQVHPIWAEDLDQVYFSARREDEVDFYHPRTRTLLCADALLNLSTHEDPVTRFVGRMLGNRGPGLGWVEPLMVRDRRLARRQVDRMLAWDIDRIVLAHGALEDRDGGTCCARPTIGCEWAGLGRSRTSHGIVRACSLDDNHPCDPMIAFLLPYFFGCGLAGKSEGVADSTGTHGDVVDSHAGEESSADSPAADDSGDGNDSDTSGGGADSAVPVGIDCDMGIDRDGDGWSPAGGDCDDDDPTVGRREFDWCDGVDNDCDGAIDEEDICDASTIHEFLDVSLVYSPSAGFLSGTRSAVFRNLYGDVVCELTYDLVPHFEVPTPDCPSCEWAFSATPENLTLVSGVGRCPYSPSFVDSRRQFYESTDYPSAYGYSSSTIVSYVEPYCLGPAVFKDRSGVFIRYWSDAVGDGIDVYAYGDFLRVAGHKNQYFSISY
jgi:hypothetical protein